LSELVAQYDLLESNKPKEVPNDFTAGRFNKKGNFQINNSRYKTRIRRSDQVYPCKNPLENVLTAIFIKTQVVMIDASGNEFRGNAKSVKGRTTTINILGKRSPGELRQVKVLGRPDLTNSEKARDEFIFLVVAGRKDLRQSPFIRYLWFPSWKPIHIEPEVIDFHFVDSIIRKMELNDSQRTTVHSMVGPTPVMVVHGTSPSLHKT